MWPYKCTGINLECRNTCISKPYQRDQTEGLRGHNRPQKRSNSPVEFRKTRIHHRNGCDSYLLAMTTPCLPQGINRHRPPVCNIPFVNMVLRPNIHLSTHFFLVDLTLLLHLHSGTQVYWSSQRSRNQQFQKVSHLPQSQRASLLVPTLWLLSLLWNLLPI